LGLPFSQTDFLDVFGAYNTAWWPVVLALWIATVAFSIALFRGRVSGVALSSFVALHWAWAGVAYHAAYFSQINSAAWLFATGFVIQAFAFAWFGIAPPGLRFEWGSKPRHVVAAVFVIYSWLYPLLVAVSGHTYPREPLFGVPCPSALFTAGVLFAAVPPVPRSLFVIPVLWSIVGGSAALLLGMTPDLMLFVAAASLLIYAVAPGALHVLPHS
jgi:hypothetical protein